MSVSREINTASNLYLTRLFHLAVEKGLDGRLLLKESGLSAEDIDRPGHRIDIQRLADVLRFIWDGLRDEGMGLCSTPIPRGAFHLMGKLAIHEPTLGRAIAEASRFYRMVSPDYRVSVAIENTTAVLRFDFSDSVNADQYLFSELTVMAWHRFFSWLIAENISMQEIYFPYPPPEHIAEYTYLFPGKLLFHQSFLGFSFHRNFLDRRPIQNALGLMNFMQSCPRELFQQPKLDFSLAGELKAYLKHRLGEGFPTIEKAADAVHMTKRTLIRKLAEEGTSYQQLKDDLRLERSTYLLCRYQNMSVGDIADSLGYSDAAVFARAFKTWTGKTPSDYRVTYVAAEAR